MIGQAIKWTIKPTLIKAINELKATFKESLENSAKNKVLSSPISQQMPEYLDLTASFVKQVNAVVDDLTSEPIVDLFLNTLCGHWGDFESLAAFKSLMEQLFTEELAKQFIGFFDELTERQNGLIDAKLMDEIERDLTNLKNIQSFNDEDKTAFEAAARKGVITKKYQTLRAGITETKIEFYIQRLKAELSSVYDRLNFTVKEQAELNKVLDELLNKHFAPLLKILDNIVELSPKIVGLSLEYGLNAKPLPSLARTAAPLAQPLPFEMNNKELELELGLTPSFEETSRPPVPSSFTPQQAKLEEAQLEDDDIARAIALSRQDQEKAVTPFFKRKADESKGRKAKASKPEDDDEIEVLTDEEERSHDSDEKPSYTKSRI